jgi:hypothetical protein
MDSTTHASLIGKAEQTFGLVGLACHIPPPEGRRLRRPQGEPQQA